MKVKIALLTLLNFIILSISHALEINYKPSTFEIYNDGHSIRIEPTEEASRRNIVIYKKTKYMLKDVHIIILKDKSPEIHFLHVSENPIGRDRVDDVLVLAVKLSPEGKVNHTLERILKKLHKEIGIRETIENLNVSNLLPEKILPFREEEKGIKIPIPSPTALWVILENPLLVSPQQYKHLKNIKLEKFSNSPLGE